MFFNKLSQKEKLGLIAAGVLLSLAFFDRLIISPIRNKIQQIDKQIEISEKKLGWNLRNINQKDVILQEYKKYIPPVKKTGSDEEEVAKVLGEIESLARNASVYLANMKPHESEKEGFYKKYAVEFEAQGKLEDLVKFLLDLNTSPQILRVEKLRFDAQKQTEDTVKISALVTKVLIL